MLQSCSTPALTKLASSEKLPNWSISAEREEGGAPPRISVESANAAFSSDGRSLAWDIGE